MKIAVLQSSYEGSSSCFKDVDSYDCNPGRLYGPSEHTWKSLFITKAQAVQQVIEASREKYDLYVNLCDGAFDEDRAGVEVIEALESLDLPYTGADAAFYKLPKNKMKYIVQQYGVHTAPFYFASDMEDVTAAAKILRFPLIVKHFNSGGSIGMTRKSKCMNLEELKEQADLFITQFGGVLIEEFIPGREFTVLVAEDPNNPENPRVYRPVECKFPKGEEFKHFDIKFTEIGCDDSLIWMMVEDETLAKRLMEDARKAFVALRSNSYGRCDFRVDSEGNIFFLEINPNCGIFYPTPESWGSADIILSKDGGHRAFIDLIIETAMRSHERKRSKFEVRMRTREGPMGIFASVPIRAGETVAYNEGQLLPVVSKIYVDSSLSLARNTQLARTGFRVSPHHGTSVIFVESNAHAAKWQYVQSNEDDFNAVFDGLNLMATQDIPRGQEIVVRSRDLCGHLNGYLVKGPSAPGAKAPAASPEPPPSPPVIAARPPN
eukprot:tig00000331_g24149.t1